MSFHQRILCKKQNINNNIFKVKTLKIWKIKLHFSLCIFIIKVVKNCKNIEKSLKSSGMSKVEKSLHFLECKQRFHSIQKHNFPFNLPPPYYIFLCILLIYTIYTIITECFLEKNEKQLFMHSYFKVKIKYCMFV